MLDFEREDAPARTRTLFRVLIRLVHATKQYREAYRHMVAVLPSGGL